MSQSETEHDRKVREYWKKFSIYDIGSIDFKDKNNELPFEPTAILAKAPPTNQPPTKRFSIYDLSSIGFTT